MNKKKVVTVWEEYDGNGNLVKKITQTEEYEDNNYPSPTYPTYPIWTITPNDYTAEPGRFKYSGNSNTVTAMDKDEIK